ncbi:uncharacterized protein [Nicotiana tomentosiformis]|uniref:uncharacterized protein n=1 Tax=Nicotiana tomentosiformis TaxID=4098 RepID=UPI00388C3583
MIEKLREEVDEIKAESLKWKEGMDHFAAKKEAARAQLSSAENQLQSMKEKSSVQARRIEELEARLASELAKAESNAEKAEADADALVAIYRADAEAAQVGLVESNGFDFTVFHMHSSAKRWWQMYDMGKPTGSPPLTRAQVS